MRSLFPAIAFLFLPFAEIATFIFVGSRIGVWATLGLVILSSVGGFLLLRIQVTGFLRRVMRTQGGAMATDMPNPARSALIVLAGILLIIPGFLTDIAGLLLLLPPLRRWIAARAPAGGGFKFTKFHFEQGPNPSRGERPSPGPRTIELEPDAYHRDDTAGDDRGGNGRPRRPDL